MDRQAAGRVKKEEYSSGGSSIWISSSSAAANYNINEENNIPQPMEGLHDAGPPPFLTKTYEIVEDSDTNHIVSWSRGHNSFVVWDPQTFSMSLLPKYFKHNNFSSFVRQLNTYGFRKVDPDRWEFANEGFLRGQKHLLKNIRRRRNTQGPAAPQQSSLEPACVEVGRFGLDGEIDRLRRDKQVLMMELVKLRQQQQNTKACLQVMESRLRRTESKQQHMMSFLAKAMQNPSFIQQLVQQKDMRKELEDAISKKRRRPIDHGTSTDDVVVVGETFNKAEPQGLGDFSEFGVPELDQLAMNIQGSQQDDQNLAAQTELEELGDKGNETDQGFWEDLLNEDMGPLGGGDDGEVIGDHGEELDIDVLVQQIGYLSSSPK